MAASSDVADVMAIAKSDALREKGQKVLAGLNPFWRFKLGECIFTYELLFVGYVVSVTAVADCGATMCRHKDHDAAPDAVLHRGVASVGMVMRELWTGVDDFCH